MVQINFARKEINCKIVYYGPGLSGKTTNLEKVHEFAPQDSKGELTSISTDGDRTLFFDFMPLDLGSVAGMRTKFHIYTVPGQAKYSSTRKLVLKNADGIVFVADSLEVRRKANFLSLKDLQKNLAEQNMNIFKIPLVLQFNKRDLAEEGLPIMPMELMEKDLNSKLKAPTFEGAAIKGIGVSETLKKCLSLTITNLHKELKW